MSVEDIKSKKWRSAKRLKKFQELCNFRWKHVPPDHGDANTWNSSKTESTSKMRCILWCLWCRLGANRAAEHHFTDLCITWIKMFCDRKDKHVFLDAEVMFAKTLLPWEKSQLERGALGVKFYIQGVALLFHKLEK